jgi:outer membrane protein assembly factor BamB
MRLVRPALVRALWLGASLIVLTGPSPTAASARVAPSSDFLTQGYDVQRTGYNPTETILNVGNVSGLHELWSFQMSYKTSVQPLFASGVLIQGNPTDVIYEGDRLGDFYAVNADTGGLIWQQFTGTSITINCGGPVGEDGTPVIDRSTNRIYIPGGDDQIHALDLSTGAEVAGWPILVSNQTETEHIYGALTLWRGRLYVPMSSYCDQPPYEGRLILIDTTNPTRTKTWLVTGPGPPSGGGIWGPGGTAIDPVNSNVYVGTGNSFGHPNVHYAEHVVRLTSGLHVISSNYPGFQPGVDLDWGATPVLYQAPGCPPQFVLKNKDGELFVYDRDTIDSGPFQTILMSISDGIFLGDVAYSPVTNMIYVPNSTDGAYMHGMNAFQVQPDCTLSLAWYAPFGSNEELTASPTVANGVVYYPDADGQIHAWNAATGVQLWNSGSSFSGPIYQSVTVTAGRVFIGSYADETLKAFGL